VTQVKVQQVEGTPDIHLAQDMF